MTVSTEISSNEYTGNGVTTDFDYKFRIFKANQLSVITSDTDGDNVVTLRLGTDYTVTGANKSAGGKVILTKPLANGHKISIARDIPIKQETSFRNQSKFFAETHEDAFDYLTMILQRIWGSLGSLYLKRPNILANWFDAKGYRIANLGKPKRDSDAVDLGTLKDEIEGVNSTILKKEKRTLRVDDMDISALPKANDRAGNVLTFDNFGNPIVVAPASRSAIDVLNLLSSNKGASLIGANSGQTVETELADISNALSKTISITESLSGGVVQFSQQVQTNITSNSWGLRHTVILGDSISHGANAIDIYNYAYASHLKRMSNASNGCNNWGFVSIKDQIGSTAGINQERHRVTTNGWNVLVNADAGHTINGALATTTSSDNELVIKIPATCKFFRVWYTRMPNGGTFTVKSNDVLLNTVNTEHNEKQGWFWVVNPNATCNPDEAGICTISIKNTTEGKPVEILGVSYANDWASLQVNNFSQAGRKLIHVDDVVLEKAVTGANPFILALGHNDRNGTASENALFTAKIDKIIQVAIAQKVRVVVCDFCWDKNINNHVRAELKRCATSIPDAILIAFPSYLEPGSDGSSASYYLTKLKFTSDSSHPTPDGHKIIAEVVARAIGLSVSSVSLAINKSFTPFNLTNSGLVNSIQGRNEYYSGFRVEMLGVSIRGILRKTGASKVPAGTYILGNLNGVFLPSITTIPMCHDSFTSATTEQFVLSISSGINPEVKLIVPVGYTGSTVAINTYIPTNLD
ncbi:hypothetical protein [Providencia sp. 1701011]|uniref:hypothetical protein n=1 Tax=Providencia sp. 1701011 TaxID=2603244 RepID=UPI0034D77EA1